MNLFKEHNRIYKKEKKERILHLKVSSPRIIMQQTIFVLLHVVKIVLWVLAIVGLVYLLVYSIQNYYKTNEQFFLKEITLETNGFLTEEKVMNLGEIKFQKSIYMIDEKTLEKTLMKQPEIVSAVVYRKYPNQLKIQLIERVPVAWISSSSAGLAGRSSDKGVLIDAGGIVFLCEGDMWKYAKDLPVLEINSITKAELKQGKVLKCEELLGALELLERIKEVPDFSLYRLKIDKFYILEAIGDDGLRVLFSPKGYNRQISQLRSVLQHVKESGRKLEWINLFPKHNIPGQYKSSKAIIVE